MPEKTGLKLLDAHLKTMASFETRGEREEYIKKMSLEKMAQIVLAAREAFIKHVDEAIPPFNSLPILFLIGATGAGKSTTLSFCQENNLMKPF
jgi:flagellar biosynthesis GTPase FlhF